MNFLYPTTERVREKTVWMNFISCSKYTVQRTTHNLGINFYVKPEFSTEYQGSMRRLEQQVEEDYVSTLRSGCYKERNYSKNWFWRLSLVISAVSLAFKRSVQGLVTGCFSLVIQNHITNFRGCRVSPREEGTPHVVEELKVGYDSTEVCDARDGKGFLECLLFWLSCLLWHAPKNGCR